MVRSPGPEIDVSDRLRGDIRIDVLGVGINATTPAACLARIREWIERGESHYVCVTGVHGVMESQRDPDLRRIHNESGLTVPDGVPMVWAGRYAGASWVERVYGPDLMMATCELAAREGWRSFFYGGSEGVAELASRRLRERFPSLAVAGTCAPPFRRLTPEEDAAVVERIAASGADLVWVGLSTPKQERWMAEHVGRLRHPAVLIGVGAAFDLHAGLRRDAPRWIRSLGLHWLFRLLQEPRRLWRRYLLNNPAFLIRVVRERPRFPAQEKAEAGI